MAGDRRLPPARGAAVEGRISCTTTSASASAFSWTRNPIRSVRAISIIQSQIAIGSGGVFGKGWMNGSQAQLEFLPERSTDFIFAVIGEEFGLLGLLVLLVLYVFVVSRAVYLATQTQDTFARLLAGSIALTFFVYVFINAGMVTGLLPVVGVPLPDQLRYLGRDATGRFGILMGLIRRKLVNSDTPRRACAVCASHRPELRAIARRRGRATGAGQHDVPGRTRST